MNLNISYTTMNFENDKNGFFGLYVVDLNNFIEHCGLKDKHCLNDENNHKLFRFRGIYYTYFAEYNKFEAIDDAVINEFIAAGHEIRILIQYFTKNAKHELEDVIMPFYKSNIHIKPEKIDQYERTYLESYCYNDRTTRFKVDYPIDFIIQVHIHLPADFTFEGKIIFYQKKLYLRGKNGEVYKTDDFLAFNYCGAFIVEIQ